MSPSEILKFCNERLKKHDMTSDGGCSDAFKKSLSEFIQDCSTRLKITIKALKLDDEHIEGKNPNILESVAQNISGITSRQLQVYRI